MCWRSRKRRRISLRFELFIAFTRATSFNWPVQPAFQRNPARRSCSTWTRCRLTRLSPLLVVLLTSSPARLGLAAEPDPRMVAPPNAVRGKLPSLAPTPARDAARTFRVLDGFRMDLLAAEPLVASPVAMTY